MLKKGGRCACIIPDGALFGTPKAIRPSTRSWWRTTSFRRDFHAPCGVQAICRSVHGGASVHQDRSGGTDQVWFYDMKADGYSLDDKRSPV